jgi:hypothetical protein
MEEFGAAALPYVVVHALHTLLVKFLVLAIGNDVAQ